MKYSTEEIIKILEDCDHIDDAIMYFIEREKPSSLSDIFETLASSLKPKS